MGWRTGPPRLRGLQAELLIGLGLVMATATSLLVSLGLRIQSDQLEQLRPLAAQSLVKAADAPLGLKLGPPGSDWWLVRPDGTVQPRATDQTIDAASLEIAAAARDENAPLLASGAPWEPVRFAVPESRGVSVMRLPPAAPPLLLAGLALGSVTVFTAFGVTVLRGRVVGPLQRLAGAVRAVGEGSLEERVPEEGVAETADVARAFNQMAEALEARTEALQKAVADLRESNQSLRTARDGLDRAERLAAVGRLASGVAHEVGNPMGALLAYLDLVGRDPALEDATRSHLAKAQREGARVRSILRELLDFSRPARGDQGPVDVAALVAEVVDLVSAQRRYSGIALEVEVRPEAPQAYADRSAVVQAVLNLVVNAADAVDPTSGRVAIRVGPAPARVRAGEDAAAAEGRTRFDAVEVRVEDDGPGIASEDLERIFDPFFTTKDPGDGTGLGLSNALRVAEQQEGHLSLEPPGALGGAVFALRLPSVAARSGRGVRNADAG
ncbi:MAG: ATP-binding protein [Myxococcota bacterium]